MISDKINDMIEQALSSINVDGDSPNSAVIKIVTESSDGDMNPDIIERVVQGLNTRRVVDQVKNGDDLEEGCDLAVPEDIKGTVVVKELKEKKAQFTGNEEFYFEAPRDYYVEKTADLNFDLDIPAEPARYNVSGYVWESQKLEETSNTDGIEKVASRERREAIQDGYSKLHKYLSKFADYKQRDEQFVEEMRYLFPKSGILEISGLEKGASRIPDYHTSDHKEFLEAEKILQQFKFIKQAYSMDDADRDAKAMKDKINADSKKKSKSVGERAKSMAETMSLTGPTMKETLHVATSPYLDNAGLLGGGLSRLYSPFGLMDYGIGRMVKEREQGANKALMRAKSGANKTVNNIERRAIFDSLVSDPEFRGVDKKKLLSLYGDLAEVSPTFSKVPAMVRSVMRAANATNNYDLSPEIISSLARAEKTKSLNLDKIISL